MKIQVTATVALLVVAFGLPTDATHNGCNGDIIPITISSETFYVDDRSEVQKDGVSYWLYLESNGAAGLQSGGDNAIFPDQPIAFVDGCSHPYPDTLIF